MFHTPPYVPPARNASHGSHRAWLLAAFVAVGVLIAVCSATSAQAALISTGACNEASLSKPFQRWGDASSYELLPGGDFEGSLAGWSLSGGAQLVAGSEPYGATGAVGSHSLELRAGASVQSPFTCVDASYPTFRFFVHPDSLLATVLVQVVYQTPVGPVALPLGAVALTSGWQPTLPMLTGSIVTGALSGGTAQAALRFTALTGSSRIDDVFVDPRMH
ncbi:MAG TPA: hypothetical protein VK790_09580 [Solirubrobacteraceae bacterium]|nr:hypothetical protein [Solirubrobacteraceae bacterium]